MSSCTDGDSQASDDIPSSLLKKIIINNEKAISDSDDIFSGPFSSGCEYKVTAFERKIHVLSNELTVSEMSSLDDNLYYVSPQENSKVKKSQKHKTHYSNNVHTSAPKPKLNLAEM